MARDQPQAITNSQPILRVFYHSVLIGPFHISEVSAAINLRQARIRGLHLQSSIANCPARSAGHDGGQEQHCVLPPRTIQTPTFCVEDASIVSVQKSIGSALQLSVETGSGFQRVATSAATSNQGNSDAVRLQLIGHSAGNLQRLGKGRLPLGPCRQMLERPLVGLEAFKAK